MRYLLFLALILFVFFAGMQAPPLTTTAQQDSGPLCFQLNADGTWLYIPCVQPTDTPFPTWTPTATNTPTPMATSTPDVEPTATQEDVRTPSPTPMPTATPTTTPLPPPPTDPMCWGTVTADSLNVRAEPWGAIVGQVKRGQTLTFDAQWYVDFWWWRIEWWDATDDAFTGAYVSSNYIQVGDTADCSGLEDVTPAQPLIVGLHVTSGNRAVLTSFQDAMTANGIPSGVKPYVGQDFCLDALSRGNWCVERWPPDCPSAAEIGDDNPEASARKYMNARNVAVHRLWETSGFSDKLVIELTNECPNEPYWWWNRWMLEAIAYAERNNWPVAVALWGGGPGHGNYVQFKEWKPALMANHARGGYLSSHNYAPVEYCGGDGSLSNGNIYCAFRHRLNYRIITEELGYDVRILITESSPTDGYQPVTGETLRDIGRYTCMIQDDPGLYGIFYWNVGTFPPFADANLGPYLPQLAQSIATCGAG